MDTRAQDMARRLNELAATPNGMSQEVRDATAELARSAQQLAIAPFPPARRNQVGLQSLRLPHLDAYSGSREGSAAFVRAVNSRLTAAGQLETSRGWNGWSAKWQAMH